MKDVTVLITCYNEREYVRAAIDGVLAQSAIERISRVIVVDDGSTDGSGDMLDDMAMAQPLLHIVRASNGGVSAARNIGLRQVDTTWVALLDGDDIWSPTKLALQLAAADRQPTVSLLYSDFVDFSKTPEEGIWISVRRFAADNADLLRAYFTYDGPVMPSTMLIRREAVERAGYFSHAIRLFEDMDFCLRLAEIGTKWAWVGDAVTYKRRHSASLSSAAERWLEAQEHVGRLCVERQPRMKTAFRKRMAFRYAKVAEAHFRAGKNKEAWPLLRRSLTLNPFGGRALAYAGLGLMPRGAAESLKNSLRRLRAGRQRPV